ncbi:hypothetical protein PILCRDRAFT_23355, partial [Piloderma croceum F 1598]
LVSPYYLRGSIINYLRECPDANKLQLLIQVASALSYLHRLSIIHGDVKGSNILINGNGEASLADFGLSRILEKSGFTTKTTSGTWRYMALELVSPPRGEYEEFIPRVTMATDVWAFAMTIVEV